MKLKFIILGLTILLICSPINAQNWFPLEVGNKWQYLNHYSHRLSLGDPLIHIYSLKTYSLIKDTSINQIYYYQWNRFPYNWIRYDSSLQKLYQWCDSTDLIVMDFTIDVDSIALLSTYSCNLNYCIIVEDDFGLGDSIYYTKGFHYFGGTISYCDYEEYYANRLGQTHYGYACSHHGGGSSGNSVSLLQANIGNSYYSHNYFPEISMDTIFSVADSVFNLNVQVGHEYNYIFPDSTPHTGLNFIDSVKIHSYYSKGSTVLQNSVVYGENVSGTDDWNIITFLNMDLMMDNYKFNYRIEAVDKGMVPHSTLVPDSGYFSAIWDTTTNLEEIDASLIAFELSQNYPNPFNPSTKIKYSVSSTQKVTLKVYDLLGINVATLVNEEKPAGEYEVEFDGNGLTSGIYFYQLRATPIGGQAGQYVETKKMVLIK